MLTEREWRRRAVRRRQNSCWGAQCVRSHPLKTDKAFHAFLLLLSVCIAVLMPVLTPRTSREIFEETVVPAAAVSVPRQVKEITYVLPYAMSLETRTYTRTELFRGRMMLLDENHPLPLDAPAPNTMSIAAYAKGSIPVRNLQLKSGRGTMDALMELFQALHSAGVNGLMVWDASVSPAEQRVRQISLMHELISDSSVAEAVSLVQSQTDSPGTGEMLQEYTVELRFKANDGLPLEASADGQRVLQTAWRYGFVRTQPEGRGAFRFRWVGRAHATAMTYLNLNLPEYLEWLHEKGVLTVWEAGTPKYVILCKPMNGTHIAFSVPEGAICEASLDNLGYAVAACTLP